jgi:hypothetical protein
MADTIRIKRRAAGGAAGAPSSLANAELAYNEQDDTLYYGTGTGGGGGSATSVIPIAGKGAYDTLGTAQTITGAKTFSVSPQVPTATLSDDSTNAASTAFVAGQNYITTAEAEAIRLDQFAAPTSPVSLNGQELQNLGAPANPNSAVRLIDLDGVIQGLDQKPTARAATTAALPANTYNNGTGGVGATLTGNSNGALPAQDGVTLAVDDLLFVINEAAPANNGLFVLTQAGSGGAPYILTRHVDMDSAAEFPGAIIVVGSESVTLNGGIYLRNATSGTLVVGTTANTFSKLNSATSLSGTSGEIDISAGVVSIDSGYVGQASITTLGTIATGVWAGTAVAVPHGGTGAATLTGYVKGSGTSALTAVTSIPNTDVSGLGTMSTQAASAVAITGGTIDGVTFDGGSF